MSLPLWNHVVLFAAADADEATEEVAKDSNWLTDALAGFETWLLENVGPPLKNIQHPIDVWLGELPMSVAMVCCIGLFVVALIWVWCLKRDFIFRGAPGMEWWRDLRIWATLVVLPYIAVYLWWGR
jgi:hypothetical protein